VILTNVDFRTLYNILNVQCWSNVNIQNESLTHEQYNFLLSSEICLFASKSHFISMTYLQWLPKIRRITCLFLNIDPVIFKTCKSTFLFLSVSGDQIDSEQKRIFFLYFNFFPGFKIDVWISLLFPTTPTPFQYWQNENQL
jgi:hypothetical protein